MSRLGPLIRWKGAGMTAVDTPAPVDETYECTFEFQRGWNDLTPPAG